MQKVSHTKAILTALPAAMLLATIPACKSSDEKPSPEPAESPPIEAAENQNAAKNPNRGGAAPEGPGGSPAARGGPNMDSPAARAQAGEPGGRDSVTDEQLQQFIVAQRNVQKLRQTLDARMADAKSPAEAQQMQAKASQAVAGAIKEAGLSTEEYATIANQINEDSSLRARVQQQLQQQRP